MKNDRAIRLRYIRALEKFASRAIYLLKSDDFEAGAFKKQCENNYKALKKIEPVRLDSSYLAKLENYVNAILDSLDYEDEFEDQKDKLLKEANLLHKEKMKNSYKKDKHKKRGFDDGY